MVASGAGDPLDAKRGEAPFAQRIGMTREKQTPEQLYSMRRAQLAQWQKVLPRRQTRNIVTCLGIGALVLERFLDELEDEAKAAPA
uniref:Cytochrome c oxidase assembly factor 3 n=1 Tax=Colobus angolensis palliatus TaxID=336983 RepID=A0A2K5K0E3_COLAP